MFRLIYRLLSAAWFRRVLLLIFGTGFKLVKLLLPEAAGEWERLGEGDVEVTRRSRFWRGISIVRYAAREAADDDLTLLASSLAFYVMLSLAPLLLVALGVAEVISPLARHELMVEVNELFGRQAGQLMNALVETADLDQETNAVSTALGGLVLFFGVAGVFGELQAALNRIWDVRSRPARRLWPWLRKRLVSLLLFLFMAAIVALAALSGPILHRLIDQAAVASLLNQLASFTALTLVFGLMFEYLPDAHVPWRQVWSGAITTSVLFLVGRFVISAWLLRGGAATPYGAAATFVVLLLACFYVAIIIFMGAEITQAHARVSQVPLVPEAHATKAPQAGETSEPAAVHRPGSARAGVRSART